MICVFDIETIPDFHLLADVFELGGSPLEIAKTAQNMQKEKSGSEFLPLCFHRVISISSVICDEFGAFKRVGHFGKNFLESLESCPSKSTTIPSAPMPLCRSHTRFARLERPPLSRSKL